MITKVHVKNFRGIADETVEMQNLTLLVGRNGAGKSSFVDVIRFVRDAVAGLDDAVLHRHGIVALRRYSPTRPYDVEIEITIRTRGLSAEYGFCIASGREGEYRVKREYCIASLTNREVQSFTREDNKVTNFESSTPREASHFRTLEPTLLALTSFSIFSPPFSRVRTFLRGLNFCSIFPNTLRKPQEPSPLKQLTEHGDNLSSVLRRLRETTSFSTLLNILNKIVENISDMRVKQLGGFLVTEIQHRMGGGNTAWFDLSQESDGTLRLIGLLVALYQSSFPSGFLAIEEPELTLHPGALGILTDVLLETSAKIQLLVTTQSPDLIARFDANSLRVVERELGVTSIGVVEETQRQAVSDQLFTSGDLLRIEGLRRQRG